MCEALGRITGCLDALSKLANINLPPTLMIPYSSIKGSSLYTELVLSITFVLLPLLSLINEFCLAVDFSTFISVWNASLCSCFIISHSASSTSATFTGIYFFSLSLLQTPFFTLKFLWSLRHIATALFALNQSEKYSNLSNMFSGSCAPTAWHTTFFTSGSFSFMTLYCK